MARLAFYTLGKLANPYDHPVTLGFFEVVHEVFAVLPAMPGFVKLYPREADTPVPRGVDPSVHFPIATLSVWTDIRSAFDFTYTGIHFAALKRKNEWVEKVDHPAYVAWWIEDDEEATFADAVKRYEHFLDHGPTAQAFTFKSPFDPEGNPTKVQGA